MYKSKTKRGILLKVSFEGKSIKNVHRLRERRRFLSTSLFSGDLLGVDLSRDQKRSSSEDEDDRKENASNSFVKKRKTREEQIIIFLVLLLSMRMILSSERTRRRERKTAAASRPITPRGKREKKREL
jgi:hypothetical protein